MKRVLTDHLFSSLICNLTRFSTVQLFLKDLGISTPEELYKTFLNTNQYKRPDFDKNKFPSISNLWDIVDANYWFARGLWEMRIISEKDLTRQRYLSPYHPTLNKEMRKKLYHRKLFTVGDLCDNFLNPDGSFKERKRGDAIRLGLRHRIAQVLKIAGFLSKEEFEKVPKPFRLMIPTDEQIGSDGNLLISSFNWSPVAIRLITRSVSIKFSFGCGRIPWGHINLSQVVQRFVRIDIKGKLHFYEKGHIGSKWYAHEIATGDMEIALTEIREKLKELNFLEEEIIEKIKHPY